MNEHNLFSVIINCHNSEEFLNECIDSVLNQSHSNLEIIIINNKSTDQTKEIIDKYTEKRIKYFETKKFLSLGAARNFGLSLAEGDFVGFLDSDDYWETDKLKDTLKEFNEGHGLVYSDVNYFSNEKSFKLYDKQTPYTGKCFEQLFINYNLCLSSVIIRSQTLKENNISFDETLEVCEDLDFFLKVARVTTLGYNSETLANYRCHNNNLTKKKRHLFFKETNYIIDKNKLDSNLRSKLKSKSKIEEAVFFWEENKNLKSYRIILRSGRQQLFKKIFFLFAFLLPYKLFKNLRKSKID